MNNALEYDYIIMINKNIGLKNIIKVYPHFIQLKYVLVDVRNIVKTNLGVSFDSVLIKTNYEVLLKI